MAVRYDYYLVDDINDEKNITENFDKSIIPKEGKTIKGYDGKEYNVYRIYPDTVTRNGDAYSMVNLTSK